MNEAKPKSFHHGSLREAAIHAVLDFVVREGHLDFSLREIAKACDVSAPAFYRHFESKEVILIEVAKRGYEMFYDKLSYASQLHASLPAEERVRELGMAYIEFALQHEGHYRVIFNRDLHSLASYKNIKPMADQLFNLLKNIVSEHIGDNEENQKEAERTTLQAWSVVHGLSHLWLSRVLSQFTEAQFLKMSRGIVATKLI
ncbi:TetR/AcrR family transcriptional regulator [Bdellovibrio sp. HCB209]|uniref:TetR/AcrR family transcriptional regulator n=1 Tax=Bdellovibrio sp. HCB209 TaxID=3394354 RepID=UPI0039B43010